MRHLSQLALDRIFAGLGAEEEQAHARACARCTARLGSLGEDHAAFLRRFPTLEALRTARPRGPARRPSSLVDWRLGLAGLVAAAALLLLIIRIPDPRPFRPAGVRSKGGSIIEVAVRRADRTFLLDDQARLQAGDVLAFRYSTQHRYLLLLSLERSGKVNVYLTDPSGRRSMPIMPGLARPLGLGVELDEYLGPERVIALLSPRPLEVDAVREAVLSRFRSLGGADRDSLELGELPLDAEQLCWLIEKVRRP